MGTGDINRLPSNANKSSIKEITFGPFDATAADQILPIGAVKGPIVLERISCQAVTKPNTGSNMNIMRRIPGTDGSIANTVTAARKIITTLDLNTLTNNTLTNLPFALTSNVPDHNVISPGEQIIVDFATTTAMDDLFITITYRDQELV